MDTDIEQANARFRGWMRELLAQAAEHFSLTLLGEPTFGWRDRSIGSRVRDVEWWTSVRHALDVLATHPTERVGAAQEGIARRLLAFFGDKFDPTVTVWNTAHGDLQWANLTAPDAYLLDWEGWGIAPAGYDAATLYCYSLLAPDTARRVYETFADILDTPDGIRAQLHVIGRLLLRVDGGDYPDLANPLHQHAHRLLRGVGH